jgi:mercuric ion transport protein
MITAKAGLSAAGAVVSAILASACCIGPAVLAFVGLGGAASAFVLAPYRPFLMALALVFLGVAFYIAHRRSHADCCVDGRGPAASRSRSTKSILWLATLFVGLLAGSSLFIGGVRSPESRGDVATAKGSSGGAIAARTTTMEITGMTCGGCVARVEERLDRVPGVVGYEVSLENNEARVSYDPAATTPEAIMSAVAETGFRASLKSLAARE